MLGRDNSKQVICKFAGHENECGKDCQKCAIAIKSIGDAALAENRTKEAIRQYKRAVFADRNYADAWETLGRAYVLNNELNNAVSAFDKALSVDPRFGAAMLGKADALKHLNRLDEAMSAINKVLELYDDADAKRLKDELTRSGARDSSQELSADRAIDLITDNAYGIIQRNSLLDSDGEIHSEREIYCKETFAKSCYDFCKKRYGSLGADKVRSESILAAFYGSICATLLYYKDRNGFAGITPFDYLTDHVNLEELDRNAEKLLGIRQDSAEAENLWNQIYSFVSFCNSVISRIEQDREIEMTAIDASESAYVMGMLWAMRHNEQEEKDERSNSLRSAFERLEASVNDTTYTPDGRFPSQKTYKKAPVFFKCDGCGKNASIEIAGPDGKRNQIKDIYNSVASEFSQLGYPATVRCYCDRCVAKRYPAESGFGSRIVFSVQRPECDKPVDSFPRTNFIPDDKYEIALAFLRGADTIQKLSDAMGTKLSPKVYLSCVHEVLGECIMQKPSTSVRTEAPMGSAPNGGQEQEQRTTKGTGTLENKENSIEIHSPTNPNMKASPKPQFCRKCGARILAGSNSCSRCGTEITEVPQKTATIEKPAKKPFETEEPKVIAVRDQRFWKAMNKYCSTCQEVFKKIMMPKLSDAGLIMSEGNKVLIDVNDALRPMYILAEMWLFPVGVFQVALNEYIPELSPEDVKNIKQYLDTCGSEVVGQLGEADASCFQILQQRAKDYCTLCKSEFVVANQEKPNLCSGNQSSEDRCALMFAEIVCFINANETPPALSDIEHFKYAASNCSDTDALKFEKLYNAVTPFVSAWFGEIKERLRVK